MKHSNPKKVEEQTFIENRQRLRDSLGTASGERGETWSPEIGDTISGEILRYGKARNDFGESWFVVIRDDEDGDLHTVFLSTVLFNRFNELNPYPQIGEWIAIKRIESPNGKTYKNFDLAIDREEFEAGSLTPPFENAKTPKSESEEDVPF